MKEEDNRQRKTSENRILKVKITQNKFYVFIFNFICALFFIHFFYIYSTIIPRTLLYSLFPINSLIHLPFLPNRKMRTKSESELVIEQSLVNIFNKNIYLGVLRTNFRVVM